MDFAGIIGTEGDEPRLSVVIPAYNEARRLERTLDATTAYLEQRAMRFELIVVDDGSRDDTTDCAVRWSASHPLHYGRVVPLRYEDNRGKGYAVKFGVLQSSGDRVLFMDADLATPIEEISKLEAAMRQDPRKIQIAIGSRPLPASELVVRQPWYRELAGRLFNAVVQMAATPGIRDTQCGFKLMTRECAHDVFTRCLLDGFSFDVEVLFLARRLGFGIAEVPVRWSHQEGAAAFPTPGAYLRHGARMVLDLARIRWAHKGVRRFRGTAAPFPAAPHPHA